MLGYLSLDIICSSKLTVFLELRSRKTVHFSEQIMSADKYPSIFFAPNGDYCLCIYPNFQNCMRCEKCLKDNKHDSSHLGAKICWEICSSKVKVFFSERIMSGDKYTSIFSRQMEANVSIFPNFNNCACCEKRIEGE